MKDERSVRLMSVPPAWHPFPIDDPSRLHSCCQTNGVLIISMSLCVFRSLSWYFSHYLLAVKVTKLPHRVGFPYHLWYSGHRIRIYSEQWVVPRLYTSKTYQHPCYPLLLEAWLTRPLILKSSAVIWYSVLCHAFPVSRLCFIFRVSCSGLDDLRRSSLKGGWRYPRSHHSFCCKPQPRSRRDDSV